MLPDRIATPLPIWQGIYTPTLKARWNCARVYSQVLRDVEEHGPRRGGGAHCPGGAAHVAGGSRDRARSAKRGLVRRQGLDLGWKEEDALLRRDALHQKHTRGILI